MSKPVVIIGAGGHARVVIDTLRRLQRSIHGVLDPALAPGTLAHGALVLGDDDWLSGAHIEDFELVNGLGLLPSRPSLRMQSFVRAKAMGFGFASVVHPGAIFADEVWIEEGAQIMAGAVLQPGVTVGPNALVNTRVTLDHDCLVGAHAHIGPGAVLCGEVKVGVRAFVGAGAVIIQGVSIGAGAQIAAGATVTRDIPASVRYIPGQDAKPIESE